MASEYGHKEKYRHNKSFSQSKITSNDSDKESFDDWKIIGMFYAGLHIIETVLAKEHNVHSEDHADRDNNLRQYNFNKDVQTEYRNLKALATKFRYCDFYPTDNEFVTAQASLVFLEKEFKKYIS